MSDFIQGILVGTLAVIGFWVAAGILVHWLDDDDDEEARLADRHRRDRERQAKDQDPRKG